MGKKSTLSLVLLLGGLYMYYIGIKPPARALSNLTGINGIVFISAQATVWAIICTVLTNKYHERERNTWAVIFYLAMFGLACIPGFFLSFIGCMILFLFATAGTFILITMWLGSIFGDSNGGRTNSSYGYGQTSSSGYSRSNGYGSSIASQSSGDYLTNQIMSTYNLDRNHAAAVATQIEEKSFQDSKSRCE